MSNKEQFKDVLMQLRGGKVQEELSELLGKMVEACRETNKKGEITLTLKMSPDLKTGTYAISESIKTKIPKHDYGDTVFYGTPDDKLTREEIGQEPIPFNTDGCNTRPVIVQ